MQSRWRSKTAWVAVIALIVFVIRTYTGYDLKDADVLASLIVATATAIGIFNNPTNSERF